MSSSIVTDLANPSNGTTVRASSTLNRDTSQYGPQHMLEDGDNAWNSAALTSLSSSRSSKRHTLLLSFGRCVEMKSLGLMFQGGFVGTECEVTAAIDGVQHEIAVEPEFEDNNEMQVVDLFDDDGKTLSAESLKITFKGSTDFYGRVTIYRLEVHGIDFETNCA